MKEEKSGSFNYIPNNGHLMGSVVVGKGDGNITCEIHQRCDIGGSIEQDFLLFHKDDILDASLLHSCNNAFLQKGVELLSRISYFVYYRIYDTANKCLWWFINCDYIDVKLYCPFFSHGLLCHPPLCMQQ